MRLWKEALEAGQVLARVDGTETGLVAWWRFEAGEGDLARDFAGGHDAGLEKAEWIPDPDPEGPSLKLYLNGEPLETERPTKQEDKADYPDKRRMKFVVGGALDSSGDPVHGFEGELQEIRIWRTARTTEQIQDNLFSHVLGEREDLLAHYPCDADVVENVAKKTIEPHLQDLSWHELHVDFPASKEKAPKFVYSQAPIGPESPLIHKALMGRTTGFEQAVKSVGGAAEYADLQYDDEGGLIGIMKRCYAFIDTDDSWHLVTGFKVGNLVTEWVGQAQFDPQIIGYIEGAPPVPSENMTAGPAVPWTQDYVGTSSVEFVEADNVMYNYSASQQGGVEAALGMTRGGGLSGELALVTAPLGVGVSKDVMKIKLEASVSAKCHATNNWTADEQVGVGRNTSRSMVATLGGNWADPTKPLNRALRRRFIPANVGLALVQSETADVYAMRLEHNGALVAFRFRPNPDIPKDWNIIPFPINPRYSKQGTLDGAVGYDELGFRLTDPDYPMARMPGEHSYFKPREAYRIKKRIDDKTAALAEDYSHYETSPVLGPLSAAFSAGMDVFKSAGQSGFAELSNELVKTLGGEDDDLPKRLAARSLANTYVWTADGGFFSETEEALEVAQETMGGSFSFDGQLSANLGLSIEAGPASASLGFEAMLGASLSLTKTKSRDASRAFSLKVSADPPGDLQQYDEELKRVYDEHGNPVNVPGKVDAYRFMTFYLEPSSENFDEFYSQVVEPNWLEQADHANARALRDARQSASKPPCWRVLHRVTFVSRLLPDFDPIGTQALATRIKKYDVGSNYQLMQTLAPYVKDKTSNPVAFRLMVEKVVLEKFPELVPPVAADRSREEAALLAEIQEMAAYYFAVVES